MIVDNTEELRIAGDELRTAHDALSDAWKACRHAGRYDLAESIVRTMKAVQKDIDRLGPVREPEVLSGRTPRDWFLSN